MKYTHFNIVFTSDFKNCEKLCVFVKLNLTERQTHII